jgi:glycosyltransferase involved in cell wall biosynthesis
MADIFTAKYDYNIEIFTSNALDFKALRDSRGKIVDQNNKFYNRVNNLVVKRFPVNYDISDEEILCELKTIPAFNSLNLTEICVKSFIKNGPYLGDLIDSFIQKQNLHYDLIHATFYPYFNILMSLIIGTYMNIPKVCTPFFHFTNPRYLDSKLIEVLRKFDLLIACTNIEKMVLVEKFKIPKDNIKVIPMGVDYDRFKRSYNDPSENRYFKQSFFNNREIKYKLILFCGYKNYEKGAISILKAIPLILKEIKRVYFVFIGPSTKAFNYESSKIQKIKGARIINLTPDNLTGYFDKKKIAAFREADLYLMPSRSDAFGISFLEAWATGNPVIGARIGATPEVIEENVDGLLVEFDDPKDIAHKVVKLLKNKKLRRNLGRAGQIKVSQNYTWDIIARKTHNTYQNLIKSFN